MGSAAIVCLALVTALLAGAEPDPSCTDPPCGRDGIWVYAAAAALLLGALGAVCLLLWAALRLQPPPAGRGESSGRSYTG
jgi:hypothetical protein